VALAKTNALIIQSRRFRETSLLLVYYTLDFGKIDAIAKGVFGTKKLFFHVFPAYVEISLYRKENSLSLVSHCELLDPFPGLHQDLKKLSYSFYVLELVKEAVRESEQNSSLFWLLFKILKVLDEIKDYHQIELVRPAFELKFLKILGYGPFLNNCVICKKKIQKDTSGFRLSAQAGGLLCRRCCRQDPTSLPITYSLNTLMNYLLNLEVFLLPRLKMPFNLRQELLNYLSYFKDYYLPGNQQSLKLVERIKNA